MNQRKNNKITFCYFAKKCKNLFTNTTGLMKNEKMK